MFVCIPQRDKVLECESDGPREEVFVSYVCGGEGGRGNFNKIKRETIITGATGNNEQ